MLIAAVMVFSLSSAPRPAGAEASAELSLVPSHTWIAVGALCTLTVWVESPDTLSCAQCILSFDPAVVACVAAYRGPLYTGCGFPTFFDWGLMGTDTVRVEGAPLGYRSFILPPGGLFKIVFEALADGISPVRIERADIRDIDRIRVPAPPGAEALIIVSNSTGGGPPPVSGLVLTSRPNPFNPAAVIAVGDFRGGLAAGPGGAGGGGQPHCSLDVYDAAGRLVRHLYAGPLAPGWNEFAWDGRCGSGARAAAGIYHAVARTGGQLLTRKLVLLR